jgi:histidinol-phosphatase
MTSAGSYQDDLELALQLADAARAISLAMFRGSFGQRRKADGSLVTDADEAVEQALRERLAEARPGDAVLGEERGQSGTGKRRWIIDAIDGTHSFAQGSDQWGTLIALEDDGEISVGVCDMAPVDQRYWAIRGGGAYRRDGATAPAELLKVSTDANLDRSRSFVPGHDWMPDNDRPAGAALAEVTEPLSLGGHPALHVAAGKLEVAVFFMGGPWDIAAPALVVSEAGGRFSDLEGGTSIARRGALFSNGHVHEAALKLVRRLVR